METASLDEAVAVLEPWSDTRNAFLLGIFSKSGQALHKHKENIQKHHAVALNFPDFGCCVTLEPLDGKT